MARYAVADDPITTLAARLTASQYLKGRIEVITLAPGKARATAPERIVLIPTSGTGLAPARPGEALRDVDQTIEAVVWGSSLPLAWDALNRFCWALQEQARDNTDGLFWTLSGVDWDTSEDTTKQGIGCTVSFTVRLPIAPMPPDGMGEIDDTSLTRV